jgi:hypothetical protein
MDFVLFIEKMIIMFGNVRDSKDATRTNQARM